MEAGDQLETGSTHVLETYDPPASNCPITLKFKDISYQVKYQPEPRAGDQILSACLPDCKKPSRAATQEKTVLNGISGIAIPGEVLAVLGPSGSGKSTLLTALAGRLEGRYTGSVLANDRPLTKAVAKRTGFVTQDDVLHPHLTVRETLVYCALLRLPRTISESDKIHAAESVIAELGLGKCQHTMVGNGFVRGVSGGERKRVSIGHEMLMKPSLLILDEPTSGLDSTAAYRLMATLCGLAGRGRMTVVASVHQPSSRVYQMFDSVLLLSEGSGLYFGRGSTGMDYFASIGLCPAFPVSPADFMLDLANGVAQVENLNGENDENQNMKQTLMTAYKTVQVPMVKANYIDADLPFRTPSPPPSVDGKKIDGRVVSIRKRSPPPFPKQHDKCSISRINQFTILLRRSIQERRHEVFDSLRVFQVMAAAILAGLMWWRSDSRDSHDRLGLLFFISIFWGVFTSFNAVFIFPQERALFLKERSSNLYALSSYFLARLVAELPMELVLPSVFGIVCYWMAGLKVNAVSFLLTMAILLGYVLVAQGFGLAFGAAIMDAKRASTVVTVTMLAFLLTGGFYVNKVPIGMQWVKYTSFTFYAYRLMIMVQYGVGRTDELMGTSCHDHRLTGSGRNPEACHFTQEEMGPAMCVGALVFMFLGYRLLAYVALRRIKV